ncbi:bifunctional riboflavin kinase/FAD synthetase [Aquamicrobium segne]|uniref:Riboflavin biosynthesis protein n=1 Tax=Aquamicrobium segne TaxID=469547 RepID=A0ABW0GYL8_9HYPH
MLERIAGTGPLPEHLRDGVVAIGNFDGVHRGHQAVLETALAEARQRNRPALVLTFNPHPRKFFRPRSPLFVLTPPEMKAQLLNNLGFSAVVEQAFTDDLSEKSAEAFITSILRDNLGICHAVTGFNFHFGKDREGGPEFLTNAGRRHGFGVTLVDAFRDEAAHIISSSGIRQLLAQGHVAEAAGQLGYRFTVRETVINGQKLGRTLGFPTANMRLPESVELREGVYAVRFRRADGSLHDGVASFGRRPTVDDNGAPLLETFVFDFSDSLYGEDCSVSFFSYLRGEEKFNGLDELVAQMRRDEQEARALLAGMRPLSALDASVSF